MGEPSPELIAKLEARAASTNPTPEEARVAGATLARARRSKAVEAAPPVEQESDDDPEALDASADPEVGDEVENEGGAESSDEDGEAQAPPETFEELAEALGVDPEEFLTRLKVRGVDGEHVPMSKLLEDLRSANEGRVLRPQLEADRAKYRTELAKINEERAQRFGALQALTEQLVQQVEAEGPIDWKKLEAEDPQTFSVKWIQHTRRQQLFQNAMAAQRQEAARLNQEAEAATQTWIADQGVKLRARRLEIPDIAKPEKFTAIVGDYLRKNLQPQEIEAFGPNLHHNAVLVTVYKAAKYDEIQAEARKRKPDGEQRVARPGARVDAENQKTKTNKRLADVRERFKRSGKLEDLAAVLESRTERMN